MTDPDPDDAPPDLAGEYVLGSLSDADAAAVRARLAQEPALQAEVYAWQDRLLPLTRRVAAAVPGPGVWRRIEQALGAADAAGRPARAVPPPWWRRVAAWQGFSGVALAATTVMGVMLWRQGGDAGAPHYLTLLQSPQTQVAGWVVDMRSGGTVRLVPLAEAPAVPPGRVLQFWTKPQGAAAPTSLGLVRPGQTLALRASGLPAIEARQLFEITLEPEGGSPIGRPTGPVLYVGRSVPI